MTDQKSKLPDLNEITGMAGKLFGDIKTSITSIIKDYKEKRATEAAGAAVQEKPVETKKSETKAEKVEKVKEEVNVEPTEAPAAPTEETKSEETKSE